MPTFEFYHNIRLKDGRTIKEHNLEVQHKIPVDSMVDVEIAQYFGDGGCWAGRARCWVQRHDRDCDGTPLYALTRFRGDRGHPRIPSFLAGYPEEALTQVIETPEIISGDDMPDWYNEAEDRLDS